MTPNEKKQLGVNIRKL